MDSTFPRRNFKDGTVEMVNCLSNVQSPFLLSDYRLQWELATYPVTIFFFLKSRTCLCTHVKNICLSLPEDKNDQMIVLRWDSQESSFQGCCLCWDSKVTSCDLVLSYYLECRYDGWKCGTLITMRWFCQWKVLDKQPRRRWRHVCHELPISRLLFIRNKYV